MHLLWKNRQGVAREIWGSPAEDPIRVQTEKFADIKEPAWDGVHRYRDVPRNEWPEHALLELLPEDRQRYWNQREEHFGYTRCESVAWYVVQQEVFAHIMGGVAAALGKLEKKL